MIGGTGRSGTTILRRIFECHPQVAAIPEFYVTVAPGGLYDFYRTLFAQWTPYLFDDRLQTLKKILLRAEHSSPVSKYYRYALRKAGLSAKGLKLETSFTGVGFEQYCPDYHNLVDALIQDLADLTYDGTWVGKPLGSVNRMSVGRPSPSFLKKCLGDFYRSLASCVAADKRATHFVEDNTWNILYLAEILELLPDVRLVHIYRDPRDVVASFTQQPWAPSNAADSAHIYENLMDRWKEIKQKVPGDSFLEISLEELVDDTERTLKKVCDFWSLEWSDQLLTLKLNKAHSGRWQQDFPAGQLDSVLKILNPYVKDLGYE